MNRALKRSICMLLTLLLLTSTLPVAVLSEDALPGSGIDSTRDASFSPAFLLGYAELLETVTPDGTRIPAGSVVYVYDRTIDDMLSVCADTAEDVCLCTLPAACLRPLSESETEALRSELRRQEGVRFFDAAQTIPLKRVGGYAASESEVQPTEAPIVEPDEPIEPAEEPSETEPGETEAVEPEVETEVIETNETAAEPEAETDAPEAIEATVEPEAEAESEETVVPTTAPEADEQPIETEAAAEVPTPEPIPQLRPVATEPAAEPEVTEVPVEQPISEEEPSEAQAVLEQELIPDEEETATAAPSEERKVTVYDDPLRVAVGVTITGEQIGGATWSSDDTSVATITNSAQLTGKAVGETYITETLPSGDRKRWRVVVYDPASVLELSVGALKLGVKESFTLEAYLPAGVEGPVTWSSSKTKVATVSASGVVTALRTGTAVIRASVEGLEPATCTITVVKAPGKVSLSPAVITMGLGESRPLTPVLPSGTSCTSYTWTVLSGGTGSVELEPDGTVIATGKGTATVQVSTYNGKTATCAILVKAAPTYVSVEPEFLSMGVGQTQQLAATLSSDSASELYWRTDGDIVTVSDTGMVKANRPGETGVYARTFNGKEDFCHIIVKPAPDSVSLGVTEVKLGVGETYKLDAELPEGTAAGLTWTSRSTKYVSVDEKGLIKGLRVGSTTVTVKTHNGKSATVKVTVCKAPTSVTIEPQTKTLGVGESCVLSTSYPKGTYTSSLTWQSGNASIAVVDASTGTVTGVKQGSTLIGVMTANGMTDTCSITVKPAPTKVAFDTKSMTICVGQIRSTSASIDAGAASALSYSSSDPTVVAVDPADGRIKGIGSGTAVITVRTFNGRQDTMTVTVIPAPTKVVLSETSITLGVGETLKLTGAADNGDTELAWSSSSTKYATVAQDGTVTGVRAGSVTITAAVWNGKKATVKVKVKAAPTQVTISPTTLSLCEGETHTLSVKVLPSNSAAHGTFKSLYPSVAEVDSTGTITALSVGTTVIRATTYNGKTADCTVTVYKAPTSISLSSGAFELGVSEEKQLSVIFKTNEYAPITWVSSDTSIAKVSASGLVTGVGGGTAEITAKTPVAGVYAKVKVSVWAAPSSVSLNITSKTMDIGTGFQLVPTIPSGSRTSYTYASEDETVATVSSTGLITAKKRGTTRVGVKTSNGKTAVATITVYDPDCPETVTINNKKTVMAPAETLALKTTVLPSSAIPALKWSSSNTSVATVSSDGLVTAKALGTTVIRVVSERNSECKASYTLTVRSDSLVLTLPAWTTSVSSSAISANKTKQEAIRQSAMSQIDWLEASGAITASDASKRRSMVNNAFKDLEFPWVTPSYQAYWKAKNSEGGAKDFKTDRVYFGMPYTQTNRGYNVSKALSEDRWTSSGSYYKLNRSNLRNSTYCGNDCSAFVSLAIWGQGTSYSTLTTSSIASSGKYRTISSYEDLRTGDLLNWGGRHVVMFLYWADDDHSSVMIIENGGTPAGTNTVHCAIYPTSYYKENGYRVRRLASLG